MNVNLIDAKVTVLGAEVTLLAVAVVAALAVILLFGVAVLYALLGGSTDGHVPGIESSFDYDGDISDVVERRGSGSDESVRRTSRHYR